jgi:hypothetical protein
VNCTSGGGSSSGSGNENEQDGSYNSTIYKKKGKVREKETKKRNDDKEKRKRERDLDEGGNDGHLVEHLDTRLYEGRPLGVVAEPIDEPLRVRTRLVLGLARLHTTHAHTHTHTTRYTFVSQRCPDVMVRAYPQLVLESIHPRLLEGVVVAAVGVELLLVVEMHDVRDHLENQTEKIKRNTPR